MNKAILIGNLSRDPEMRTTASGVNVCSFGLAVNRRKAADGTQACDFFNVTAWRQLGESCAKYLTKGRKACVTGQIQMREYTATDGTRRTAVDIIADEVEFLPSGQRTDAGGAQTAPEIPATMDEARRGGFADVDDELPF